MRESTYTAAINKLLRGMGVFAWKVHDSFSGGTPDAYYEGRDGSVWVEYKYLARPGPLFKADLSALQARWLARAHGNGQNVRVVVGSPVGSWMYAPLEWLNPVSRDVVVATALTKKQIAEALFSLTGPSHEQKERKSANRKTHQTSHS